MPEQTRETLYKHFSAGQLPTEAHFRDLVDSMLNMQSEGFRKTPEYGMQVMSAAGKTALLSFYRDHAPDKPRWAMHFGAENDRLQIDHRSAGDSGNESLLTPAVMTLDVRQSAPADGRAAQVEPRVGINTAEPLHTLDVAGTLASRGRVGRYDHHVTQDLPADGEPHVLIDKLTGCHAFEIMAGVSGLPGSGRFALLHAVALNAFNPRPSWWSRLLFWRGAPGINATSAHYGRRCDQLRLRWEGSSGKGAEYKLCIGTRCRYDGDVKIRVGITQLWFDPQTQGQDPGLAGR
jgi:hypothetical protein